MHIWYSQSSMTDQPSSCPFLVYFVKLLPAMPSLLAVSEPIFLYLFFAYAWSLCSDSLLNRRTCVSRACLTSKRPSRTCLTALAPSARFVAFFCILKGSRSHTDCQCTEVRSRFLRRKDPATTLLSVFRIIADGRLRRRPDRGLHRLP